MAPIGNHHIKTYENELKYLLWVFMLRFHFCKFWCRFRWGYIFLCYIVHCIVSIFFIESSINCIEKYLFVKFTVWSFLENIKFTVWSFMENIVSYIVKIASFYLLFSSKTFNKIPGSGYLISFQFAVSLVKKFIFPEKIAIGRDQAKQ